MGAARSAFLKACTRGQEFEFLPDSSEYAKLFIFPFPTVLMHDPKHVARGVLEHEQVSTRSVVYTVAQVPVSRPPSKPQLYSAPLVNPGSSTAHFLPLDGILRHGVICI